MLAPYILQHPVEHTRSGFWNTWAHTAQREISSVPSYLGVEIQRTVKEAYTLDDKIKNQLWKEATQREIDSIQEYQTFELLPPGSDAPSGYQLAPLKMVFDVKSDLKQKARLGVGGHKVNANEHTSSSSVVRLDSTRLLNLIAKAQGLKVLAGDVGNAYLNAETNEKVYCICGLEFGPDMEGRIAIIKKGLYGLKSSGAQWHAHLTKTLYTLGFNPTQFVPDVWYKLREYNKRYDYISTYVDEFLITAKDPWVYMKVLQEIYTIKNPFIPDYYLGANYVGNVESNWYITAKQYILESIKHIETRLNITLREERTPMATKDHPEEDSSPLLDSYHHPEYQAVIGMLQWVITISRADVCYATSSLSRFSTAAGEGHLSCVLRVWGYFKKYPNRAIKIDSLPFKGKPNIKQKEVFNFADQYSYAVEEMDKNFPKPLGEELDVNIFFHSDHGHDRKTGQSISGIIVYVGNTPIIRKSRRQGAVQTSTYGAELCAMRMAVEEAIPIGYMLRSFGICVSSPTSTMGDNERTIIMATTPECANKKKHVALSYHFVREQIAVGTVNPQKIDGKDNVADLLTKALDRNTFMMHTSKILSVSTNPMEKIPPHHL